MKLEFNLTQNGTYVAEVKVTGDFNLHLETKGGIVNLLQRGSEEGEYAPVTSWSKANIIDCDFGGFVYPKYIKVVSGSEVVSASVNFNEGGGSGSESGSGESNVIYYKFSEPIYFNKAAESDFLQCYFFSGARGYYNKSDGYYYGTLFSVNDAIMGKYQNYGYIDALAFRPIQYTKALGDTNIVTYNDFESLSEALPHIFGALSLSRITAEEYWEHFKE